MASTPKEVKKLKAVDDKQRLEDALAAYRDEGGFDFDGFAKRYPSGIYEIPYTTFAKEHGVSRYTFEKAINKTFKSTTNRLFTDDEEHIFVQFIKLRDLIEDTIEDTMSARIGDKVLDNVLDITNRKTGNWTQIKSNVFTNNCKCLEIKSKYPLIRLTVDWDQNVMSFCDKFGSIYLLDTNRRQFKQTLRLKSCPTALAFNPNKTIECNLIVTTIDKTIHFFNYCPTRLSANLLASIASPHKTTINCITFCDQRMMTSSKGDKCLIWDLIGLKCVKQLVDIQTKQSVFWSHLIITSYTNRVFILDSHNYNLLFTLEDRQLLSVSNDHFFSRSKDCLEIHCLNDENRIESKSIEDIKSDPKNVKEVIFCHNFYIYLTIDGFLFCNYQSFEDMFTTIAFNRQLLTAITANQSIVIFDLNEINNKRLKTIKLITAEEGDGDTHKEIKTVRKLALILVKKYRKLPKKYRFFIWFKQMNIPLNYNSFKIIENQSKIMSNEVKKALEELRVKYELFDTKLMESLLSVIAQLVYLRPNLISNSLSDLALFCFPFVKVLHKNETILLETLLTLIDNQYFHSSESQKTVEIVSIVEQIIKRESQTVAKHLQRLAIDWRDSYLMLIMTAFSEVFLQSDWLTVWDQLFAFGPQMFVYLSVSYCLHSKHIILSLNKSQTIKRFFRSQAAIRANHVIESAHKLSQKYVSLIPYELKCLPKNGYF